MKKMFLISLLLLFVGVSMKAQSVASEQMDEQFSGKELPYGWFAEGWEMNDEDGVVQSKATESQGFDFNSMMNMNPTQMGQGNGPMQGMFGGPRYMTYLLTPPLNVKEGEKLVISAKKTKTEGGLRFRHEGS